MPTTTDPLPQSATTASTEHGRTVAQPSIPLPIGLVDELRDQARLEQFAVLTSMPSLSTLQCVTSRHPAVLLPQAVDGR